jgi:uncharacterized membrane protein
VTELRLVAQQQGLRMPASIAPIQKHFPRWMIAGLLIPLPTVLGCLLFIYWAALSRVSPLLETLVLVLVAAGVLSCVMLPLAIGSIAKKQSELSVRNVAQIVPAVLVSLGFVWLIAVTFLSP